MIYKNVLDLIGNTPIVELPQSVHGTSNRVLAKLEYFNPTHSMKDRIGYAMIKDAEQKGLLKKGMTIVEPTSGNTGVSLAYASSVLGYRFVLVMPEHMTEERKKLAKYLGAELVLTPKEKGVQGSVDEAYKIAREQNGIVLDQFKNPANFQTQYEVLGKELFTQTNDGIDILVGGVGTGGSLTGASAYLKEHSKKSVYTIAVEPIEVDVLEGGTKTGPHAIQGIAPGFKPDNYKEKFVDEIFHITKEQAFETTKMLAKKAGIVGGISAGAAGFAALEKAKQVENKTILFIVPDFAERYISNPLFD